MKFKAFILCVLLSVFVVSPFFCSYKAESSGRIVRVACFSDGDYFTLESDGNVKSYGTEYLNRIAEYTGMDFQFIDCGTWANSMQMLKDRKVDLLGTFQATEERREIYDICNFSYGTTCAAIAALPGRYIYKDYEAIANAKIGCEVNYVRKSEFLDHFKSIGIDPQIVWFNTYDDMKKALEDGSIDMASVNTHVLKTDWDIVDKYYYSPFYFATWKGNTELLRSIDEAIVNIGIYDPDFQNSLTKEYFPDFVSNPFSKEEYDYLAENNKIKVSMNGNFAPFSYVDDSGNMQGIFVDMCNLMGSEYGVEFEYSNCSGIVKPETNYFYISYEDTNSDQTITNTFFECQYCLYTKVGRHIKLSSDAEYTIAISDHLGNVDEYLKNKYPNCKIEISGSPLDCLKSVTSGKADMAFMDSYTANYEITSVDINDIKSIPTTSVTMKVGVKINDSGDKMVMSILNTLIGFVDDNQKSSIIIDNTLKAVPDITLDYIIRNNLGSFVLVIIILSAAVIIFFIWLSRYRMLSKQKEVLAESNEKLEKASTAKSDFLSRMSHDMRTPMNAIIGMTDLALEQPGNSKQTQDYLEKIDYSGKFLLGLINDILDMSKIENNAIVLSFRPYSAEEFRENIDMLIRPLCDQKNIEFQFKLEVDSVSVIKTDKLRFNQIFFNLLSNAVKFTPEGGKIEFIIYNIARQDGFVTDRFIVRDNGRGMSNEFMEHLFEPFTQEKPVVAKESTGTGLGLAIVSNLVKIMGGKVSVKSELGKGTEFMVDLTAEICETENKPDLHKDGNIEILGGKRALLCEDNEINTEIAKTMLERVGMQVECAVNGKEGVQMFSDSKDGYYNIILMDVMMPVMDGIDAVKEIRAADREYARSIPIIAMTANAFDEDVKKSKDAGMNAHIAKPVNRDAFYKTLTEVLYENKTKK